MYIVHLQKVLSVHNAVRYKLYYQLYVLTPKLYFVEIILFRHNWKSIIVSSNLFIISAGDRRRINLKKLNAKHSVLILCRNSNVSCELDENISSHLNK